MQELIGYHRQYTRDFLSGDCVGSIAAARACASTGAARANVKTVGAHPFALTTGGGTDARNAWTQDLPRSAQDTRGRHRQG